MTQVSELAHGYLWGLHGISGRGRPTPVAQADSAPIGPETMLPYSLARQWAELAGRLGNAPWLS